MAMRTKRTTKQR